MTSAVIDNRTLPQQIAQNPYGAKSTFIENNKFVSFYFGLRGLNFKLTWQRTVRIFTLKNLSRKLKFTLAKLSNIITRYRPKPKLRNDRPITDFMLNSGSLNAAAL